MSRMRPRITLDLMKNRCAVQPQSEDPNPGMGTETPGVDESDRAHKRSLRFRPWQSHASSTLAWGLR